MQEKRKKLLAIFLAAFPMPVPPFFKAF